MKLFNVIAASSMGFAVLAGCQTSPPDTRPSKAHVLVPQMQGRALEELVGYNMRSYGWVMVERKPGLMLFDRPIEHHRSYTSFDPTPARESLRARIVFEQVPEGTVLKAQTEKRSIGAQEPIMVAPPTTPRPVESVLQEVRRLALLSTGKKS